MSYYGKPPEDLGVVNVSMPEVTYFLYLPVSLPGMEGWVIPPILRPIANILFAVREDLGLQEWRDKYVYITVKKMFVSPDITANRPGWHADGFGTNDINYVWYDCLPTEFAVGQNFDITEGDHVKSLEEFADQAQRNVNTIYPNRHLLKLDPYVVHRVAMAREQMMRTFVKVSVSKDQYNLKDNSINHDLAYRWQTYDRAVVRNDPTAAQKDSYTPVKDDHFV